MSSHAWNYKSSARTNFKIFLNRLVTPQRILKVEHSIPWGGFFFLEDLLPRLLKRFVSHVSRVLEFLIIVTCRSDS